MTYATLIENVKHAIFLGFMKVYSTLRHEPELFETIRVGLSEMEVKKPFFI